MASPTSLTVSVALCTHNGADYLREQLLSILNQTVPAGEIVVSDDASTDDTIAVLEETLAEWAAGGRTVPTVTVLRNEPALGVTANFEQALSACTGDILMLSDQDDVWQPDKLGVIVAAFEAQPGVDLVFSDARMVDAQGAPLGPLLFETLGLSRRERELLAGRRAFDALLRRNVVTGATAALRRGLVQRSAPFPAAWVHDEWLAIVAAAQNDILMLDRPLIDYRQHGRNQIGATSLTATGALARLRTPRAARNARLLARAQALAERMPEFSPPPGAERVRLVQQKLAHERRRSSYPAARLRRIGPVWRAWRAGGYDRFGLGLQDVVRDLLQPE
ncbi:hypothetical protein AWU67_02075 [Microterricola viridarii]|uniref:Glycosyltransferase 2-like domain-containing protein n=2 Tax=Microterricola viridarii TaxID=412690 RepID=A0A0Y0MLB5_9MICO|nr:hypothetical protein AWU67_02075 [Microterricola viridarii]